MKHLVSKWNYFQRIFFSRLAYPIHLNLISAFVYLFGSLKNKILFDTFRLPHYAYGIYEAARRARAQGLKGITVIEFGVANGRGLMAMAIYARKIQQVLQINICIVGFDSGEGMPAPVDYRDHPELYTEGDFPMIYRDKLLKSLPSNTTLYFQNLIEKPLNKDQFQYPIGFISIDVDYYSSTVSMLNSLAALPADKLLPNTLIYLDDIMQENHNPYQGELLAIDEFNNRQDLRKIYSFAQNLRPHRILKDAAWINQIFQLHVLDHAKRQSPYRKKEEPVSVLGNKYLN